MAKINKLKENQAKESVTEIYTYEKKLGLSQEPKEISERKELTQEEISNKQIRQEIENMDLDDSLKIQAGAQANKIQSLDEQEKIKNLLQIARLKGVVYAVNVVKKMNDPYLLDTFHDILASKGYYKKFTK